MKKTLLILLAVVTLYSCDENGGITNIKSTFDSPFPKRVKDLTFKLGNEFSIKHNNDTIDFELSFNKTERINYIVNKKTNDTIFSGIINKYKGLYYFNKELNDSTYWIYAVEINNGIIRGLGTEWLQMSCLNEEINRLLLKKENYNQDLQGLIKTINKDTSIIQLIPDKKIMKRFYSSIIDSLPTDTIIDWFELESNSILSNNDKVIMETELIETENNEIILNLYPNPANEFITLKTNLSEKVIYYIININGQIVRSGQINSNVFKIDVSEFYSGTYFIQVYNETERKETVKLIIE